MNGIGWAVKEMHNGNRVRRAGWNGKGMWLALIAGSIWNLDKPEDHKLSVVNDPHTGYQRRGDFVAMRTADGSLVPWLCSQTDLLAVDWELA